MVHKPHFTVSSSRLLTMGSLTCAALALAAGCTSSVIAKRQNEPPKVIVNRTYANPGVPVANGARPVVQTNTSTNNSNFEQSSAHNSQNQAPQAPNRSTTTSGLPAIPGTDRPIASANNAWNIESEDIRRVSFAVEGADFDPCLTPDGRHIVFASTQHSASSNIYVKSVTGLAVTQVTSGPANDVMPSVSPDGTRIAFASDRNGNWDIMVVPFNGGRIAHISTDPSHELHPTWSPDGKRLAFCRLGAVSGRWEIWVTEPDNPGVAQFVTHGMFPQWCPVPGTGADGADQILFQRSRDRGNRAFSVWTVDYKDGMAGSTTEIVSHPGAACINPTWSPDGNWVVFAMVPADAPWDAVTNRPARASLWMVSSSGGSLVGLAAGQAINLMPAWGRDNTIYFVSNRGGTENIWSLNAASALAAAGAASGATLTMPVSPQTDLQGPGR